VMNVHQGYHQVRDIIDGQLCRPCSRSSSSDGYVSIVMSYEVLPWQSCGATRCSGFRCKIVLMTVLGPP